MENKELKQEEEEEESKKLQMVLDRKEKERRFK